MFEIYVRNSWLAGNRLIDVLPNAKNALEMDMASAIYISLNHALKKADDMCKKEINTNPEYILYVRDHRNEWQRDCSSYDKRELLPVKRYFEREGKEVMIIERIEK